MSDPAVLDIVSPHIDTMNGFSELQPQPPIQGVVIASVLGVSTTVLWKDGRVQLITHAANQSQLDIITAPTNVDRDRIRFRMVRRDQNPGNPASAQFDATVVSVHIRTPADATPPGTGPVCALVKTADAYFEDLASSFVIVQGR